MLENGADFLLGITYYILYGRLGFSVDIDEINKGSNGQDLRSKEEIERFISDELKRPIYVVGASTGSDTHSVGIDAILNHKGYNGHPGLEAFRGFVVRNMGSQVPNERLVAEAVRLNADAILVSQTVSQQDLHIAHMTSFVDMMEAEGLRERFILICGGAHVTAELAKELGYDAGFSKGSYAEHVARFLVSALSTRGL